MFDPFVRRCHPAAMGTLTLAIVIVTGCVSAGSAAVAAPFELNAGPTRHQFEGDPYPAGGRTPAPATLAVSAPAKPTLVEPVQPVIAVPLSTTPSLHLAHAGLTGIHPGGGGPQV